MQFLKNFDVNNKTLDLFIMNNNNNNLSYYIQITTKKLNFFGKNWGFSMNFLEKLGIDNVNFATISEDKKIVIHFILIYFNYLVIQ